MQLYIKHTFLLVNILGWWDRMQLILKYRERQYTRVHSPNNSRWLCCMWNSPSPQWGFYWHWASAAGAWLLWPLSWSNRTPWKWTETLTKEHNDLSEINLIIESLGHAVLEHSCDIKVYLQLRANTFMFAVYLHRNITTRTDCCLSKQSVSEHWRRRRCKQNGHSEGNWLKG